MTTVKKLESGYWHVRFGRERFIQWPTHRLPTLDDVFGWVTEEQIAIAIALTRRTQP